jgi:hypothetical protein
MGRAYAKQVLQRLDVIGFEAVVIPVKVVVEVPENPLPGTQHGNRLLLLFGPDGVDRLLLANPPSLPSGHDAWLAEPTPSAMSTSEHRPTRRVQLPSGATWAGERRSHPLPSVEPLDLGHEQIEALVEILCGEILDEPL